jgi:hypothetical protein
MPIRHIHKTKATENDIKGSIRQFQILSIHDPGLEVPEMPLLRGLLGERDEFFSVWGEHPQAEFKVSRLRSALFASEVLRSEAEPDPSCGLQPQPREDDMLHPHGSPGAPVR